MKRHKTNYPGVFYREADRIGGKGAERVYYILFKKDGEVLEEKVGRQFVDDMTPARAAGIRAERIEGKRLSRKQIREEQEAAKEAERNRWTIEKLWTEYKKQTPLKGLAQDESRYRLYIEPTFKDKQPETLIPLDVDRMRVKLMKSKSPQTVKNILALLRRIVGFGVRKGLCKGPDFVIQMPGKIDNVTTEDLTAEQLKDLLETLDKDPDVQVRDLMKLALASGLRRGELFALEWNHIDFERRFIDIRDPKSGTSQKVPLNEVARKILEGHPRIEGSPYVFPGRGGKRRVEARKSLTRIKKAAKLPKDFRPLHGLRHVYASMLASSGIDLFVIQRLLNHRSSTMTQRYAHLRDAALRKASDLAGEIIEKATKGKDNVIDIIPAKP